MENLTPDIPVIKTFLYNGQFYVYDTYTNSILRIKSEHFKELKKLQNVGTDRYIKNIEDSKEYNDICMLIQKGVFKSGIVSEIKHPYTQYVPQIVENCVNGLFLQVTRDCNFKCRYCSYATNNGVDRTHEKMVMTWDTAKKAIDFLFMHSTNAQEVTILFYGGEPLLNFELIKKVVEYSNELFRVKKIQYSMTVNGSIMTEDMIRFFVKNNFHIAISFDGYKKIQDMHRKFALTGEGTYDMVHNNIEKIRRINKEYFETNIVIMPVFFEDEDFNKLQEFFDSEHYNCINPLPVNLSGIDYKFNAYTREKMKNKNYNTVKEIDSYLKYIHEKLNNKDIIQPIWHHNGPCIAGVNRLFVNVYGDFYPCERGYEEPVLSIGNIETGYNMKKILEFLNIGLVTEEDCKTCWAMRYCKMCVLQCYDIEQKVISKQCKKIHCEAQRKTVLEEIKKYIDSSV